MRIVVTAVVCLLAVACQGGSPADDGTGATEGEVGATEAGVTPAASDGTEGEVAQADGCGPVETIPIQGEGHLLDDQEPPVPYNSTPPTSGWHASGDVEFAVYGPDEVLTEPEQVTVLELGGVVVSYNGLADDEIATLEDLVTDDHAGNAALTPYDQLGEGEVAITAWATLQRCDGVDEAAISAFIEAHANPAG